MRSFADSSRGFSKSEAGSLAKLASAAADIALIIDKFGTIRELAGDNPNLPLDQWSDWVGRPWSEVVSVDSRPKVEAMQRDASAGVTTRWRHLNHPGRDGGESVPVMYRVVPLGSDGSMVAVGRTSRKWPNSNVDCSKFSRPSIVKKNSADRPKRASECFFNHRSIRCWWSTR